MQNEIYLDNSATTKPYDEVIEYINQINKEVYGNPSSMHTKGIEAEKLIKTARQTVADSIGADSKEIYFTSGGTESNNLAIRGYLEANIRKGKHIITTAVEHPSVLEVYKYLETIGYKVDYIGVNSEGVIDIESLKSKITSETTLISVIYINNETGAVQPIDEVVKIKNSIRKDAVIHVDAVQAYGKIKINPKKQGLDMMSISSHKIHGPKGIGALYVSKNIRIKPILFGGGQESLIRSGTENVSGICGFGLASQIISKSIDENSKKVGELKALFIQKLKTNIESFKIVSPENSSPYVLNVAFDNLRAEVLLHHLEEKNIFVSTGSACSSRKNIHSHVLKAMGLAGTEIEGAIRFSFSAFNSKDDVLQTIETIKEIIPRIQIKRCRG